MTTRTLTHPNAGPVLFDATTRATDIHVATADVAHATVTIETSDTTGPAHDAIQAADLTARSGYLGAVLNDQGTNGSVNITNRGVFIGGNNYGGISTGHGITNIVAGGRIVVNGVDVTDMVGAGQSATITMRATLPIGSSIDLRTASADITVTGDIASATARTVSGGIEVGYAQAANLNSTSGRISLDTADSARIQTVSGRISVGNVGAIIANSVSGRIEIDDTSGVARLSTTSGRIDAGYSGPIPPALHSISGRTNAYRLSAKAA